MRTATTERTRIPQAHDGEWLYRLLGDIREEMASQPNARAIERMRGRVLAQLRQPAQAAA
ncbi:MAG: hypothetical protein Q8S13_02415 [Dehalococcoidia bacterium]|nr:hypothetical protein [Dehalococcoidia bacterium]